MKAILLADLYGVRKSLYLYVLLIMAFMVGAVSSATVASLTFALCAAAGAGMLPVQNLERAETSHWDRCVQAMPCTRRALCGSMARRFSVPRPPWVAGPGPRPG